MAFNDNLTVNMQRILANVPQLAVGGTSVINGIMAAFTSADADTQALITAAQTNMFLSTAIGAALDARAADFNVRRFLGTAATLTITFSVQVAPTTGSIVIPAGTVVSTFGDGISTIAQSFITTATATIPNLSTTAPAVAATATVAGLASNVAIGTVTIILTNVGNGAVLATNTVVGAGGLDPDTDAILRKKAFAAVAVKYGAAAIQFAAESIAGVFDVFVFDPQDGSGTITYYWCDANGAQVLASASAVDLAVRQNCAPGVVPTAAAFTVINLSQVQVIWSAPTSYQTSALGPQIQTAVAAYIQTLQHNQIPDPFNMAAAVQLAVNNALTFFAFTGSTPITGSASNTVIYRCTAGANAVVATRQ